jgi:hypothetical protein
MGDGRKRTMTLPPTSNPTQPYPGGISERAARLSVLALEVDDGPWVHHGCQSEGVPIRQPYAAV